MMDTATAAQILAGTRVGDNVRFVRVTTDSYASYRSNPQAWTADSIQA